MSEPSDWQAELPQELSNPYPTTGKLVIRNDVIEECARVAEEYKGGTRLELIAAIRALKDKP